MKLLKSWSYTNTIEIFEDDQAGIFYVEHDSIGHYSIGKVSRNGLSKLLEKDDHYHFDSHHSYGPNCSDWYKGIHGSED